MLSRDLRTVSKIIIFYSTYDVSSASVEYTVWSGTCEYYTRLLDYCKCFYNERAYGLEITSFSFLLHLSLIFINYVFNYELHYILNYVFNYFSDPLDIF